MEDEVDVSEEKKQKKKDLNKIFWSIKKIEFFYQNNQKKHVSHSSNIVIFSFIQQTNHISYVIISEQAFCSEGSSLVPKWDTWDLILTPFHLKRKGHQPGWLAVQYVS